MTSKEQATPALFFGGLCALVDVLFGERAVCGAISLVSGR